MDPRYTIPTQMAKKNSGGMVVGIIVVLLLIAGGAAYYFLVYKKNKDAEAAAASAEAEQTVPVEEGQMIEKEVGTLEVSSGAGGTGTGTGGGSGGTSGASSTQSTGGTAAPSSAPVPKWAVIDRGDRGGADIKWGMNDLDTCKSECAKDSNCKAVIQIPSTGACGLKSDVSGAYSWDDRKMYLMGTGDFAVMQGVDVTPGANDIAQNDSDNIDSCKAECLANPNCKSFIVGEHNGKTNYCWHKGTADGIVSRTNRTTYVKLA